MRTFWEYSGCDLDDQRSIENGWERYQDELSAKMAALDDPPTELRIAVWHEDVAPAWRIQGALHLPGGALAVEGAAQEVARSEQHIRAEVADEESPDREDQFEPPGEKRAKRMKQR